MLSQDPVKFSRKLPEVSELDFITEGRNETSHQTGYKRVVMEYDWFTPYDEYF